MQSRIMYIEDKQLAEVDDRARGTVELGDDEAAGLPGGDLLQGVVEGGAVEVLAGVAFVARDIEQPPAAALALRPDRFLLGGQAVAGVGLLLGGAAGVAERDHRPTSQNS